MSIPVSARALGWAGILPFAAATAGIVAGWPSGQLSAHLLLTYGAVILSFMAGCQWGLTLNAAGGRDRGWRGYAASVVPALLAWAALLAGGRAGIASLALVFLGLLAYDLWTVRRGEAPRWYGRLRIELTLAVVLLLGLGAAVIRV